ncbi:unnamed protein product, partial [Timema podura]|nr:unnamed protein product [Timema podura]
MVWLIANNLDYDTARNSPLVERFPFLEFSIFVHDETKKEFLAQFADDPKKQELVERISRPGYEILEEMTSPRFI